MKEKDRDKLWKEKIDFNFKEEYRIYKNLCKGLKWWNKKLKPEVSFVTYFEWKHYIIKKYCINRTYISEEFVRHLNFKKRRQEEVRMLNVSYLLPFVVAILSGLIISQLSNSTNMIVQLILFWLIIGAFTVLTNYIFGFTKDNSLKREFLIDIIGIIESQT